MARTGFFLKTPMVADKSGNNTYSLIDVGGELFHALAVALMDRIKVTSRLHEPLIKIILERFFAYYPKYKTQQPYLTPGERMGMLMNNPRKSDSVERMAYVLRQLAIDEVYENPLLYREVFDGLDPTTPKSMLRNSAHALPLSILNALAQRLKINISIAHSAPGKELWRQEIYSNSNNTPSVLEVELFANGSYYAPRVKNKADFAYVGQLAISLPQPQDLNLDNQETIEHILALIAGDNQQLMHTYQQWQRNLLTMLESGELKTTHLLRLYVQFLPLTRGMLQNPEAFFAKWSLDEPKFLPTAQLPSSQQQINQMLASTLAQWISTKRVDNDVLFAEIELQSKTTSHLLAR